MKQAKLLSILLISIILNISCEDDKDYGNPTIEFKTGAGYLQNGESLEAGESGVIGIKAFFNSNDNITNLKITLETADGTSVVHDEGINVSELDFDYNFTRGLETEETYICKVTDIEGHSAEISMTLGLEVSPFGEINSYSGINLGAQNSTVGHFYSLADNSVYTDANIAGNESSVDMVYYVGKNNETISSPAMSSEGNILGVDTWTTKNETLYAKTTDVTDTQFDEMQNDELLLVAASIAAENWKAKAKDVSVGDYYYFKTQNNKYGLLRVTAVTTGNDGTVTFDVKVQK